MKRYLAFACLTYYPSGGMQDCVGAFDTVPEAKASLDEQDWGGLNDSLAHGHIFDLDEGVIVFAYHNDSDEAGCEVSGADLLDIDFSTGE